MNQNKCYVVVNELTYVLESTSEDRQIGCIHEGWLVCKGWLNHEGWVLEKRD